MINVDESVEKVIKDVIKWRRYFHKNPELSGKEINTSKFVLNTLRTFDGLETYQPTSTSVVAKLIGKQPGKTLAFRADMDALPIQEENEIEYASQVQNVMHACGHDGHTAMLLGTAKILSEIKDEIKGEIIFIFQHAEETVQGGREIIATGIIKDVDCIIASHLWSTIEIGKIGIANGPAMAASDGFILDIHGKGGHASEPQKTVDPITIGAEIITNIQQVVSRKIDPLDSVVISITEFHAGTAINIIPETAKIVASVRSLNDDIRENLPQIIEKIISGIVTAHDATYEFNYIYGVRPLINYYKPLKLIEKSAKSILGDNCVVYEKPRMAAEDFSEYLKDTEGAIFFIGAGNKKKGIIKPQHNPKYMIDEESLKNGVKMFIQIFNEFYKSE